MFRVRGGYGEPEFRVEGQRSRWKGLEYGMWGLGFRVWGVGFRIQG